MEEPFKMYFDKPLTPTVEYGLMNILLANPTYHVFETESGITVVDSDEDFSAYRIRAIASVNKRCEELLKSAAGDYPELEISSFSQQEQEARQYLENPTIEPTLLKAIAESREIPLDELVAKVIENADTYNALSGRYMGLRRKQLDRINNCTTLEELKEVMETSVLA